MKTHPSPAAAAAAEYGIECFIPSNDLELAGFIKKARAQFLVVCAYGRKLGATALNAPSKACLNIHASLLPRWRGAAPVERAILAGDAETGITIIEMNEKIDTGDICLKRTTKIGINETSGQLRCRLAELGVECILEALDRYDSIIPKTQPETGATRAHKLSKNEAKIDWAKPADELVRAVRAFNPSPGAYSVFNGLRVKIMRAQTASESGFPGEILSSSSEQKLLVACGQNALEILDVIPAGARPMHAADFLRGHDAVLRIGNKD